MCHSCNIHWNVVLLLDNMKQTRKAQFKVIWGQNNNSLESLRTKELTFIQIAYILIYRTYPPGWAKSWWLFPPKFGSWSHVAVMASYTMRQCSTMDCPVPAEWWGLYLGYWHTAEWSAYDRWLQKVLQTLFHSYRPHTKQCCYRIFTCAKF